MIVYNSFIIILQHIYKPLRNLYLGRPKSKANEAYVLGFITKNDFYKEKDLTYMLKKKKLQKNHYITLLLNFFFREFALTPIIVHACFYISQS